MKIEFTSIFFSGPNNSNVSSMILPKIQAHEVFMPDLVASIQEQVAQRAMMAHLKAIINLWEHYRHSEGQLTPQSVVQPG